MKSSRLPYLIFFFKLMTSTISDKYSFPNGNNYSLDEYSARVNFSLEVGNFSQQAFNYSNTLIYETVVERVASRVDFYFTPCLVTLGISGNLLSLYVFYFSKLRYQSTSQYLSALAVSDSVFLGDLLPPWLSTMEITGMFHRDAYCKGFVYISYVTCCLSSWLVIAFTIERFVAVQYPLQRSSVCTVKRARSIIAALTVGAMLVNLPVIHLAGSENQMCHIDPEKLEQAAKFNWVDTTVTFTIPLILIIFFNTWIAAIVYKLERDRIKLTQEQLRATSMGQQKLRDSDFIYPRSQRRITNMLLIVSTIFVLFNCPAYTLRVCGYAFDMDSSDLDNKWLTAQKVATMMFDVNFGTNFFLYCLTGQNFRRALVQTVPCCGWFARKASAVINRSTVNHARNCSVTMSAASTGTEAACTEMSWVRTTARRRHHRSGNYILRWTFDNSRQRATEVSGTSESICMHEIVSRPGPSRDFTEEQPRAGTSHAISSEQARAVIKSRRTAIELTHPAIESRGSTVDSRHLAIELRRPAIDLSHPSIEPRRPGPSQVIIVGKRKTRCCI